MATMPDARALTGDPLDIMLRHDAWGTRLLIQHCRGLSREQFHQRFEMGLGSLHDTFTHMIGAMRRWTDRFAERPLRPPLAAIPGRPDVAAEAADRTPDELLALHEAAAADLASAAAAWRARPEGLASTLTLDWPDKDGGTLRYTFTRAAVLVHVSTHGMHHRAQCLNMLRKLGVPGVSDKLPETGVVDWQEQTEAPPVKVK